MPKDTNDQLLEEARALGERAAEADSESRDKNSLRATGVFGKVQMAMESLFRFLRFLGPVGWFIKKLILAVRRYVLFASFKPEGNDPVSGDVLRGKFSLSRFAVVNFFTILAVIALHAALSALYFYSTLFSETVYVTGKQEIETGELYQFGGCTALPCSTEADNGKFYLIESSLYFPSLFYPEEEVFANIPQQDAACVVEGYGIYFRRLRFIYKSLQLYQHAVDVSCRPYTAEEIAMAVGTGVIVDESKPNTD